VLWCSDPLDAEAGAMLPFRKKVLNTLSFLIIGKTTLSEFSKPLQASVTQPIEGGPIGLFGNVQLCPSKAVATARCPFHLPFKCVESMLMYGLQPLENPSMQGLIATIY
jgi:hypothetical protein